MDSPSKTAVCPDEIKGTKLTIVHCVGAWETFLTSLERVQKDKRNSIKHQMNSLVKRLAEGDRLSKDSFPPEGELPSLKGKPKKHFYAFKKIPVRAYGWYSDTKPKKFFISHYIYKKTDKLSQSDTSLVQGNWTRIEVNGHEK
ncbi:hypothetical protein MVR12_005178 [Escherichia coli]|nr:hypothetical protein [Escherichia coli]